MKLTVRFLLFLAVLFAASCTQSTDMLTVINPDGSCYREFTANANKQFVVGDSIEKNNPFPVDIDATCQVVWKFRNSEWFVQFPASKTKVDSIMKAMKGRDKPEKKKEKSDDFFARVRINYASVEDMAVRFKLKESHEWSKIKVKYSLDKKFRWFYTYYKYRETYPKIETGFKIPIEKYVTHDEAMYWFTGVPNIMQGMNGVEMMEYGSDIENKLRQWFNLNLWNAEYTFLLANYDKMKDKPVSKERLANLQDTIFNAKVNSAEKFKMKHILDDYFKTDVFSVFWKSNDSQMEKYENFNQGFLNYFTKTFTYKLVLPGKIIQPNNAIVQGDTLIWKLTAYRMIPANYVIEAQSRKANVWAFILTGILALVAVASFIWKPGKR